MSQLRTRSGILLTTLTALLLVGSRATALESASILLDDQPVVRAKAVPILSPAAQSYFDQKNTDTVRVWVFFTDKGVRSRGEFQNQAAAVELSEKVLLRRAKVDLDQVVFADLPVPQRYIEQVSAAGGVYRRTSRWLNAASFDVATDDLDEIAALPAVAEVRPVAQYTRPLPDVSSLRMPPSEGQALAPDALNYGYATQQIEQMNVPAVHNKGYSGAGVTLAVFDTGFRKTHEVFANAFAEGRVLAEWDFVFNDGNTDYQPGTGDVSSSISHGTLTWSTSGGNMPGKIIGPAYKANFLLAKTEDVRDETIVEEDNWVAALEWADGLGADVITSSLGYSDWYTYADMDGATAVTTVAANTAAGLGIVVCNSMGNNGSAPGTLSAPADAHDIISCGAVDQSNIIAGFSSRGPTYDGRIKPEVVARGVSTQAAVSSADNAYGSASGTSLSTPLVAGVAVLLVQARPQFTPLMIRQSLMETADKAGNPGNNYGWGLVNADSALSWGINFQSDVTIAQAPVIVHFTGNSTLNPLSWKWHFGDGDSAMVQSPAHKYNSPGAYSVSLTIETTQFGMITTEKLNYIVALADTLHYGPDSAFAGDPLVVSIEATNSQALNQLIVPLTFDAPAWLTFDSASLGSRTDYFERFRLILADPANRRYAYELTADFGGGSPPLAPGAGEILKVYFTTDLYAFGGQSADVDSLNGVEPVVFSADYLDYTPQVYAGVAKLISVLRGDANYDLSRNVADLTYMVNYLYRGGPEPVSLQAGDINGDFSENISDITFLVNFLFKGGTPPPTP